MQPDIRRAGPDDLKLIVPLLAEFYAESGFSWDQTKAVAALRDLLDDSRLGHLWLINSSGEPVGYILLTFGFSLEYYGRDAFVDEFFVRNEFRGLGFGTLAFMVASEDCQKLGINAIHLEVEHANPEAHGLYRRLGFEGNERHLLSKRLSNDE